MKLHLFIACVLIGLSASSCSKDNGATVNTISINGVAYPTVTIGSQVWTTQNYSGPGGGEIMTPTGDPVNNGNYYNTTAITLPEGWRVPSRQDFNTLLSNYSTVVNAAGDILCDEATTENLMSKSGWTGLTGSNSTGFNAYSAGYYSLGIVGLPGQNPVSGKNDIAYYLTSTTGSNPGIGTTTGNYVLMISNAPYSYNNINYYTYVTQMAADPFAASYVSVRFVKNN